MRRWRERMCARADLIVTPSAAILPPERRREDLGSNGAPTPIGSARTRRYARPSRGPAHDRRGLRRRVPLLARRRSTRAGDARGSAGAAGATSARCSSATVRAPAVQDEAARPPTIVVHRRRSRTPRCRRHSRPPISASRRSTSPPRAPVARLLLVAAQDFRVHGGRPARRRAGASIASRAGRARARGPALRPGAARTALADALERWPTRSRRRSLGRARPASAPCASTVGRRTAQALEPGDRGSSDSDRVVHAQIRDPPRHRLRFRPSAAAAAGARTSWRAACARAATTSSSCSRGPARQARLRERDLRRASRHRVRLPPRPTLPFVRNYFKNERLYPALADALATVIPRAHRPRPRPARDDAVPAIDGRAPAGRARRLHGSRLLAGVLLVGSDPHRDGTSLCPACSAGMMTQCVRPRAGAAWPLALPMIPYMRANLAAQAPGLAAARTPSSPSARRSPPTCARARRSWRRRG